MFGAMSAAGGMPWGTMGAGYGTSGGSTFDLSSLIGLMGRGSSNTTPQGPVTTSNGAGGTSTYTPPNEDGMVGMAKQLPMVGSLVGAGPGTGATKGAIMGTQVMPGWGTLIGAAVGAGLGMLGGDSEGTITTTTPPPPGASDPLLKPRQDTGLGISQLMSQNNNSLFPRMFGGF